MTAAREAAHSPAGERAPEAGRTWRRAARSEWYDREVTEILSRGLPDIIKALSVILDDIDSRLGLIEYTLAAARIESPPGGVPDPESPRFYAFYTLGGTE